MSANMTSRSDFNTLLHVATSITNCQWTVIMEMNNRIWQRDVSAKDAIYAISQKIRSYSPRTSYNAVIVLESCVNYCGTLILDEIATKSFMDHFYGILVCSTHEIAKSKALGLIQTWACAFRHIPKYRVIDDIVDRLKDEDYMFPAFKESDPMLLAYNASTSVNRHRSQSQFGCVNRSQSTKVKVPYERIAGFLVQQPQKFNGRGKDESTRKKAAMAVIGSSANAAEQKACPPLKKFQSSQEPLCEICEDAEKKIAFLCGHRACYKCAEQITECHMCRKNITHRITLY